MEVEEMTMFGKWKYDIEDNTCRLCRKDLMMPTEQSLSSKKITCNVDIGKCTHGFHSDCIDKWLKAGNMSCPTCTCIWNNNDTVSPSVNIAKA